MTTPDTYRARHLVPGWELDDTERGTHAATYHGIAAAECLTCGVVTRDASSLEVLNDLDPTCDTCGTHHVRWTLTDGTTSVTAEHIPCDGVGTACTIPTHDHTTMPDDGRAGMPPVPMLCNGCGVPAHYAEETSDYWHDSPDVPACFLASSPDRHPRTV